MPCLLFIYRGGKDIKKDIDIPPAVAKVYGGDPAASSHGLRQEFRSGRTWTHQDPRERKLHFFIWWFIQSRRGKDFKCPPSYPHQPQAAFPLVIQRLPRTGPASFCHAPALKLSSDMIEEAPKAMKLLLLTDGPWRSTLGGSLKPATPRAKRWHAHGPFAVPIHQPLPGPSPSSLPRRPDTKTAGVASTWRRSPAAVSNFAGQLCAAWCRSIKNQCYPRLPQS